ncbi:MAG: lysoplasmalogenase [Bacilli bacterium]|nr:lysoplasmalogenase [Bacilli bacterium]
MDWTLIPVVSYVFFGLFVVASIVHLVFCYIEFELARKITKCMTTGMLAVAVICAIPTQPLVYCGLLCGLAGDAFLLKKHKVWPFACGMISFLLSHVLYIAGFMVVCGPLHWAYYVASGLYVVLFPLLTYHFGNTIVHQKHLAFGGVSYFGFLSLDLIWAIIACCNGHVNYCLLCVFGALSFIASDVFLARTLFKKDVKRRDFFIMATYLVAQGLICTGFVMTFLMR